MSFVELLYFFQFGGELFSIVVLEIVDKEFTVEVVDLVLEDACEQTPCLEIHFFPSG